MSEETKRRVSDVVQDEGEGTYVAFAELVDQEISINALKPIKSKFGDALIVEYLDPMTEEQCYTITSGVVVMRKLLAVKDAGALPILALIGKEKQYYTIS